MSLNVDNIEQDNHSGPAGIPEFNIGPGERLRIAYGSLATVTNGKLGQFVNVISTAKEPTTSERLQ